MMKDEKNKSSFKESIIDYVKKFKLPLTNTKLKHSLTKEVCTDNTICGLQQNPFVGKSSLNKTKVLSKHEKYEDSFCSINFFGKHHGEGKLFFPVMKRIVYLMRSLATEENKLLRLTVNVFLTGSEKHVPQQGEKFDFSHINSASCIRYNGRAKIEMWRKEELIKVFIHELIHAFNIHGTMHNNKICDKFDNMCGVSGTEPLLNETFNEFVTIHIICAITSLWKSELFRKSTSFEEEMVKHIEARKCACIRFMKHQKMKFSEILNGVVEPKSMYHYFFYPLALLLNPGILDSLFSNKIENSAFFMDAEDNDIFQTKVIEALNTKIFRNELKISANCLGTSMRMSAKLKGGANSSPVWIYILK